MNSDTLTQRLADTLVLGEALSLLGRYELVDHWKQGEFHHDVIVKLADDDYYLISTNCNGGIKEVIHYDRMPDRSELWRWRTEENGTWLLAGLLETVVTVHWFPPTELLYEDARSEILPEYRERQEGGGWKMKETDCDGCRT